MNTENNILLEEPEAQLLLQAINFVIKSQENSIATAEVFSGIVPKLSALLPKVEAEVEQEEESASQERRKTVQKS